MARFKGRGSSCTSSCPRFTRSPGLTRTFWIVPATSDRNIATPSDWTCPVVVMLRTRSPSRTSAAATGSDTRAPEGDSALSALGRVESPVFASELLLQPASEYARNASTGTRCSVVCTRRLRIGTACGMMGDCRRGGDFKMRDSGPFDHMRKLLLGQREAGEVLLGG